MTRREHIVAGWMALGALMACSRGPDSAAADHAPSSHAPTTAAAADATAPNKVLDPAGWSDPRIREAYAAAKQYAHVLERIYCYCRCKENHGHRALVECFESDHASHCDVCMDEAVIAARMTREGKTPAEIQKAIDKQYG